MESFRLSSQDKEVLVALARSAILRWLGEESREPPVPQELEKVKRGIFVTLRQGHELRGCIGYVEPIESIADAVRHLAVKSASEDSRFAAIHVSEMQTLSVEISVLSPLSLCPDISTIEVGRHGLVVEQGGHRGLLLPEVASEAGWDRETFVRQCCRKAGLPPNTWKAPDVKIYTFVSEHFGEAHAGNVPGSAGTR